MINEVSGRFKQPCLSKARARNETRVFPVQEASSEHRANLLTAISPNNLWVLSNTSCWQHAGISLVTERRANQLRSNSSLDRPSNQQFQGNVIPNESPTLGHSSDPFKQAASGQEHFEANTEIAICVSISDRRTLTSYLCHICDSTQHQMPSHPGALHVQSQVARCPPDNKHFQPKEVWQPAMPAKVWDRVPYYLA